MRKNMQINSKKMLIGEIYIVPFFVVAPIMGRIIIDGTSKIFNDQNEGFENWSIISQINPYRD